MVWNHIDLASNRLFKKDLPIVSLVTVDALGFLSFLALLITNGIVASELGYWRTGDAILLAYTSVPWMFCWFVGLRLSSLLVLTYYLWCSATHGFILLQSGSRILRSRGCSVCPNCRRSWETTPAKGPGRANYSQVVSGYESDDVEATLPSGSETSEGHEQAPEMRESADTTDEASCLIYRNP